MRHHRRRSWRRLVQLVVWVPVILGVYSASLIHLATTRLREGRPPL